MGWGEGCRMGKLFFFYVKCVNICVNKDVIRIGIKKGGGGKFKVKSF